MYIKGEIKLNNLFAILACLVSATIVGFSDNVYAADTEAGEQIFSGNCAVCHSGGNNAIIPEKTLQKEVLAANSMNSVDAIVNQVTNGKGAMPAFGGRLTDENIQDVANYVLSQSEQGW